MVTEVHDAELGKRQLKTFQGLDDPPDISSKSSSWRNQKNSVSKNRELWPQLSEIITPPNSLIFDKFQLKITETENIIPSLLKLFA